MILRLEDSESLARAVASYLEARYSGADLAQLRDRDIQEHDGQLARTLYNWRDAAGWPEPEILGEERCIVCHKIMDDESSVYEDETVCRACAGPEIPADA